MRKQAMLTGRAVTLLWVVLWACSDEGPTNTLTPTDTVFFHCDWPSVGTSATASLACGGSSWPNPLQFGPGWENDVVAASSVAGSCAGAPTTNVWRINGANLDKPEIRGTDNVLPLLTTGGTIAYRWYECYAQPIPAAQGAHHGDYDGFISNPSTLGTDGPLVVVWRARINDTSITPGLGVGPNQGQGMANNYGTTMTVGTWYRYEYLVQVVNSSPCTITVTGRMYNAGGTLLETLGPLTNRQCTTQGLQALRGYRIGINGCSGCAGGPVRYYAAFAVGTTWLGAYPISGVEP